MIRDEIFHTYLCCPACGGKLNNYKCISCHQNFPNRNGIINFRLPKNIITKEEESLIAELFEQFEATNFSQLMHLRFQHTSAPSEFIELYKDYQSTLLTRGKHMIHMFQKRITRNYEIPDNFLALDLGCGVGASSAVLAKQYQWVIAIDPSLADLILAKKYFSEQNINNVILIQAAAQNLPIHSNVISFAVALNVIEHLFDVHNAFAELNRVLKAKGIFCGDSRNRFDLFFPEPHAQLHWVGFWPRRLQPWYVKKFRNITYSSAYLLSWLELRKYAQTSFGNSYAIVMPLVSAYGQSSRFDKLVEITEQVPILRHLAILFFPSHLLIAQKINATKQNIKKENTP